jgi:uncharacterized protein with PIN domain
MNVSKNFIEKKGKENVRKMDCVECRKLICELLHNFTPANVEETKKATHEHLYGCSENPYGCAECQFWFKHQFLWIVQEKKKEFEEKRA